MHERRVERLREWSPAGCRSGGIGAPRSCASAIMSTIRLGGETRRRWNRCDRLGAGQKRASRRARRRRRLAAQRRTRRSQWERRASGAREVMGFGGASIFRSHARSVTDVAQRSMGSRSCSPGIAGTRCHVGRSKSGSRRTIRIDSATSGPVSRLWSGGPSEWHGPPLQRRRVLIAPSKIQTSCCSAGGRAGDVRIWPLRLGRSVTAAVRCPRAVLSPERFRGSIRRPSDRSPTPVRVGFDRGEVP